MNLTHDQLAASLARHLLNDDRLVWEDIPSGRAGSPRPDVFTIQKSFSSPNPISYEIKVSVSDFRSDITKAKWQKYMDFSYGVIFAVPKGLIKKSDIPNGCGLIQFNGQSWHTVKKPTLQPKKLDDELLLKLLIEGSNRETKTENPFKKMSYDEVAHNRKLKKKFGEDFAKKITFLDSYDESKKELESLKAELGALFDINTKKYCFAQDVAYAIEKLKSMANEDERNARITLQLEAEKKRLIDGFDSIIRNHK